MSKKRKRKSKVPKSGAVWHQSSYEATMASKPHYNGYAVGYGVHGDTKYNRAKENRRRDRDDFGY